MSSCRLGRRPVDLLHEVADLHAYVERELHGVAVAVSDLDGFFFAASQSTKNEKNTRESDQAAERALAGRRLHSILSRGRKRILSALARQRTLLWEFARAGNLATGAETTTAAPAAAEGERPQRDRKKERTANGTNSSLQVTPHHHHQQQQQQQQQQQPNGATAAAAAAAADDDNNNNNNDGNNDDSSINDDDWKRHTLVGMHRLLSRKASEPTATATAKATIIRDMTKIAAALRQLGVQTTAAAAAAAAAAAPLASGGDVPGPRPSSKTHPVTGTSPFAPPADNLSPQRVQNTLRREGEGQRCDGRTTTSSSSCSERAAHRQSEGVDGGSDSGSHPLSSSSSSSSRSSCDALLLLHQQLRNSDGIDALLRRISEGVRPSNQNPAPPAASPAAKSERLCTRPGNNGGPTARAVAMPPFVASENTGRETRQRSTCSDDMGMGTRQGSTCGLSTPGCSNPRVGVGVARDGEREVRCTGQEVTGSVGGLGGGGGGGVDGTAGKERREKMLSPVGLSGAFCGVPEEGGGVSQRPADGLRRIQLKEAFGEGGKDGIASNALIDCREAVGGRGKDGSPNDLIEHKEAVRRGGKDDSPNDLIEREEAVRGGGGGGSPNALIEREEAVEGGGVDGSPNALNLSSNRGSLKPGLSCSNVAAVASPSKSCLRSSGQGGNGSDDKENRRVGVIPSVEAP